MVLPGVLSVFCTVQIAGKRGMSAAGSYGRAVLKVSGDAFCGEDGAAIDGGRIQYIAAELKNGLEACPQLAVVVGGGNIIRGAHCAGSGLRRIRADQCGMLATVVNALALRDRLELLDVPCAVLSALPVEGIVDGFGVERCLAALQGGKLVLLAGGTGNPLFTTDTAAALRAVQVGADIMLKATRVDGVYSADPEKDSAAQFYRELSFEDAIQARLGVMDLAAMVMCSEHCLPVRVFNYRVEGNLRRVLDGEPVGTLIRGGEDGR